MGARGVGEGGLHHRQRRLDSPGGRLLPRSGGYFQAGGRVGLRSRDGLDQYRGGFREHASDLVLLPGDGVAVRALFIAPLALVTSLAGQGTGTVYGTVRDSAGRPIGSGIVVVVGTSAVARISQRGDYRAVNVPAGQRELQTKVIGYGPQSATVSLAPGDSVRLDFTLALSTAYLSVDYFQMQPVVVTAAKRPQSLEDVVPSVALMSDADIAKRAVNTIDEAVDKAPGVQFLSGQVNIRGSSGFVEGLGSRVLLLVDGVPANQGDRGGINWDLVPVEDVARVEVVKGAGSALYGSAALGGVVNVITRDIPIGFHARGRVVGGWFADPPHDSWKFRDYRGAQEGLDVTTSYGTDVVRGSFTAGGWHSDGYREQDRRNHWQTAGKAQWVPSPGTQVMASGSWASDQYETPLIWCI